MRLFHDDARIAESGWIWVFGSCSTGIHAIGDAKIAKHNFGAAYGVAEGRHRSCYAIPVVGRAQAPLSLETVAAGIDRFLLHARAHPRERFFVTRVGCVDKSHPDEAIAPLFAQAPMNCSFPSRWRPLLDSTETAINAYGEGSTHHDR